MINLLNDVYIYAQTGSSGGTAAVESLVPLDFIWEQIKSLTWIQAVIAISFGAVYMLYGCKIFKVLVVIAFSLLGMTAGVYLGQLSADSQWQIWGGVIGAVLLGAVSIPLMRWAVSLLGALAGGVLTAAAWYAFGLPENYLIIAGALIGVIAGGMLSFIIFDAAVVLFTSLGGGGLVMIGILALLRLYEPTSGDVYNWVYGHKWFLPVSLMIPTVLGVIVQNRVGKGDNS